MYKTKTVQFHMGYTAFNSTVYMTWEICSLIHGPSHPSVCRMQYPALALQAINAEKAWVQGKKYIVQWMWGLSIFKELVMAHLWNKQRQEEMPLSILII